VAVPGVALPCPPSGEGSSRGLRIPDRSWQGKGAAHGSDRLRHWDAVLDTFHHTGRVGDLFRWLA
jgi:hypothetical protein